MLQRKEDGSPEPVMKSAGYMVSVEYELGTATPEQISLKLADSLSFVEGVGDVDVTYIGNIEFLDEAKATVTTTPTPDPNEGVYPV